MFMSLCVAAVSIYFTAISAINDSAAIGFAFFLLGVCALISFIRSIIVLRKSREYSHYENV
jgi:hypothetical protein